MCSSTTTPSYEFTNVEVVVGLTSTVTDTVALEEVGATKKCTVKTSPTNGVGTWVYNCKVDKWDETKISFKATTSGTPGA
jgi:hypothetical protein